MVFVGRRLIEHASTINTWNLRSSSVKPRMTYELLDRTPPTSLKRRIATENLPYSGTWTFSLQPNGENTVVRITEDGQVHNPVFRFMSRLVFGHTRTMDNYLRALGKATGREVEVTD